MKIVFDDGLAINADQKAEISRALGLHHDSGGKYDGLMDDDTCLIVEARSGRTGDFLFVRSETESEALKVVLNGCGRWVRPEPFAR
jgi:hypothetical protein